MFVVFFFNLRSFCEIKSKMKTSKQDENEIVEEEQNVRRLEARHKLNLASGGQGFFDVEL